MSEEKPRLSRREMREQGLLKVGREDDQVSRDDLLTRTSELQLRRPSRREMRLQREANEAKTAEQSAKFSAESPQDKQGAVQAEKTPDSRSVHTFNFPALDTSSQREATRGTQAADASVPQSEQTEAKEKTDNAKAYSKDKTAVAESGRSSVFDRFHTKDKEAVSFRDRLVARTREGQREARESQPSSPADTLDVSEEQVNDLTQLFETVSDEPEAHSDAPAEDNGVELPLKAENEVEESPVEESLVEESSVEEDARSSEEKEQVDTAVEDKEPQSESAGSAAEDKQQADGADGKTESDETGDSASEDTPSDSSDDSTKESNAVAAVAEDGRYPTDVTMRIGDDDEEKTRKDLLTSALIILVGLLGGVILGLIAQKLIFGAEGSLLEPVESIQACVLDYEGGAELQLGL